MSFPINYLFTDGEWISTAVAGKGSEASWNAAPLGSLVIQEYPYNEYNLYMKIGTIGRTNLDWDRIGDLTWSLENLPLSPILRVSFELIRGNLNDPNR